MSATPSSAISEEAGAASDSGQTRFGPDVPACRLLPISELEAHFGAKVKVNGGLDAGNNSTCTAEVNGQAVNIQTAAPGTGGLPTTIPQGLAFATMLGKEMGKSGVITIDETKDFGSVGCYTGTGMVDFVHKQKLAKPIHTTTCFQVSGGYLILTLASEDPNQVSYEAVKRFLEIAAARRR